MSTPPDKIPPPIDKLFTPSDATRISVPKPDPNKSTEVGWREFVKQFLPESVRGFVSGTEEVREGKEKSKVRGKIPIPDLGEMGPFASKREREEHERLVTEAASSDLPGIYPREMSAIEKFIPREVRDALSIPDNFPIKKAIDVVTGGNLSRALFEETATGLPFAGRLFSRLDRAIESMPQAKAQGKQWLAQISKGVPEQEAVGLRKLLNENPEQMFTKEQVMDLKRSEKPVIGETVLGDSPGSSVEREIEQLNDYQWDLGNDLGVYKAIDGEFVLRNRLGGTIGTFRSLDEAVSFGKNIPPETPRPKWNTYLRGRETAEDYSEIVLQLNDPRINYKAPQGHWDVSELGNEIKNPISHLRMTTRQAIIPDIAKRSAEEFAQHRIQEIKKIRQEGYTFEEAKEIYKEQFPEWQDRTLKVRQIDELQSDWAQSIRRKGSRYVDIDEMPDPDFGGVPKDFDWDREIGVKSSEVNYEGQDYILIYNRKGEIQNAYHKESKWFPGISPLVEDVKEKESIIKHWMKKISIGFQKEADLPVNMPFKKTDQWVDLTLERAIQDAIDRDIDVLTWAPGQAQYDLYGSELVRWEPRKNKISSYSEQLFRKQYNDVSPNFIDDLFNNEWNNEALEKILLDKGPISVGDRHKELINDYLRVMEHDIAIPRENVDKLIEKYPDAINIISGHRYSSLGQLKSRLSEIERGIENSPSYLKKQFQKEVDVFQEMIKLKTEELGKPSFFIQTKRQHQGNIPEIGGLEDIANQHGINREDYDIISSKEELEKLLKEILDHPEDVPDQAEKIWNKMMKNPEGISLPRKEGMEYFYNELIPRRLREVGKKMGVNIEFEDIVVDYGGNFRKDSALKQKAIRITPELKKSALEKGYPILGVGGLIGAGAVSKEKEEKNPMDNLFK